MINSPLSVVDYVTSLYRQSDVLPSFEAQDALSIIVKSHFVLIRKKKNLITSEFLLFLTLTVFLNEN